MNNGPKNPMCPGCGLRFTSTESLAWIEDRDGERMRAHPMCAQVIWEWRAKDGETGHRVLPDPAPLT